jgi:hypothetical protein
MHCGSSVRDRFIFVHKRIVSAVRSVWFIGDRMSHTILRGRWCSIVLNVHVPCEDKGDDVKDSFCEESERVFDQSAKSDKKNSLGKLNAKVGWEDIFKSTIGNESSHEISNDNEFRAVNFAHI